MTSESGRVRQRHPIFLFVWNLLTPSPFEPNLGGPPRLSHHFAPKTSCRACQHCAEWSCAVANHHPRRRGKTGRDWPYKGRFTAKWFRRTISKPVATLRISGLILSSAWITVSLMATWLRRNYRILLLLLGALALLPSYLWAYALTASSESPTLNRGDRIIVNKASYGLRLP